jgi:hypothetical protein
MIDQCSNCSAFLAQSSDQGICRANPPAVLMVGVRQTPAIPGILNSGQAEPQFMSVFPPMKAAGWCRAHSRAGAVIEGDPVLNGDGINLLKAKRS